MKATEILTEGLALDKAEQIIKYFIKFCQQNLNLDELPKIDLITGSEQSVKNSSFGGYGGRHIRLSISNRHIMDVCRTLAHELVHFKQDLDGALDTMDDPGADGSPIENEANAKAAVIMRKWGKQYPKLFAQQAVE
jgi:hypothetical protein